MLASMLDKDRKKYIEFCDTVAMYHEVSVTLLKYREMLHTVAQKETEGLAVTALNEEMKTFSGDLYAVGSIKTAFDAVGSFSLGVAEVTNALSFRFAVLDRLVSDFKTTNSETPELKDKVSNVIVVAKCLAGCKSITRHEKTNQLGNGATKTKGIVCTIGSWNEVENRCRGSKGRNGQAGGSR